MNKNFVLCGFMGSGKSVTGKALAERLNMDFIDMDAFIETKHNLSVSEIFEKFGEEHFRKLETEAAIYLGKLKNIIISCGGGTVMRPENVAALKKNSKLFYLSVKPETVIKRLEGSNDRPLLQKDKENTILALLKKRIPVYEAVADHSVDANKDVAEVVKQILKIIQEA